MNKPIITTELLKELSACKEGNDFFERNFNGQLDLNTTTIEGDFCGYFSWLFFELGFYNQILTSISTIHYVPNGNWHTGIERDEKGRIKSLSILEDRDAGACKHHYKYDDRDNLIHRKSEHTTRSACIFTAEVSFEYDHNDQGNLTEVRVDGKACLKITYNNTTTKGDQNV